MSFNHSVQNALGKLETLKSKVNRAQQKGKEVKGRSSNNLNNWNSKLITASNQLKEIKKYKKEINDFFQMIKTVMVELKNLQKKIIIEENKVMTEKSTLLALRKRYNQVSSKIQNVLMKWEAVPQTTLGWHISETMYSLVNNFSLKDLEKYLKEQDESLKTGEEFIHSFFEPSHIPQELLRPELPDEAIDAHQKFKRKKENLKNNSTKEIKE